MPRTSITPVNMAGGSSQQVAAVEFTWTAADAVNFNSFASSGGKAILLVRNVNADSPGVSYKITLHNAKTGATVEKTLGAGEYCTFGQLPTSGWEQGDNTIYVDSENTDLEFAVLVLP